MLASGDAADRVAATLRGYGADIEVLDGPAGLAATRKLLRSVFYKGMAASIVEALEAARAAGLEDWLRPHIAEELAKADASTVERIVTGTRSTPSAAVTRWRPPPRCSPTWASSPSWPTPAAPCTSAWPQNTAGRIQQEAPRARRSAKEIDRSTSGCTQRSTIFAPRPLR